MFNPYMILYTSHLYILIQSKIKVKIEKKWHTKKNELLKLGRI